MKQNVMRRAAGVLGASAIVVALACSDSGTSEPLQTSRNNGPGGGLSADTGSHTGGTGGNPHDSGNTPAPKPVASFTLAVHVGVSRVGGSDTLLTDPVAGATVTVAKFSYTFINGGGNDTLRITEVPVATAVTGANGDASFPGLKGDPGYVVTAAPPAGLNLTTARLVLPVPYSETMRATLVLRKP